jgi:hypothetical protein
MQNETKSVRNKVRFSTPIEIDPVWIGGSLSLPVKSVDRLREAFTAMQHDGGINVIKNRYDFKPD